MSTQTTDSPRVPTFNLADRLAKARTEAGISREQLAAELGYSPKAISDYQNGHVTPRRAVIAAWALRCNVDAGWLETGEPSTEGRPDGGPSEVAPGQDIPLRRCEDGHPGLALVA
jgi:transcriptional regulator with XRE-family HTH domain